MLTYVIYNVCWAAFIAILGRELEMYGLDFLQFFHLHGFLLFMPLSLMF